MAELVMPKMGESIMEATILKWLKKEGDTVEQDEAVLEIATDKVDSEVPSPYAGVLSKILFEEGAVVPVGGVLATIGAGDAVAATPPQAAQAVSAGSSQSSAPASSGVEVAEATMAQGQALASMPAQNGSSNGASNGATAGNGAPRFYSPLVLNIAAQEGIGMVELERLPGTGSEGRVTKKDILAFVEQRKNAPQQAQQQAVSQPQQPAPQPQQAAASQAQGAASQTQRAAAPAASTNGAVEIIEMDRMRKLIADHMVRSVQTSPHVTSFVECDVTNLVMWRERIKAKFEKREGQKLTFTPIFIEAVARAIKDFPLINVSVEGSQIIVKKEINIGMAAALPSGNLIVPVIRRADRLNLVGLAEQVNDLANRSRAGKLKPEETSGGTYTVTNVGTFGNVMGTPIINQPQVAILALGAIRKKPAVIETPQGDFIGIRHMMFLSHSYDHRVVDGALGGMFVRRVADYLEQWDVDREA